MLLDVLTIIAALVLGLLSVGVVAWIYDKFGGGL